MALLYAEESFKINGAIYEVHKAQVINYLALAGLKLGLLVNFNAEKVKPERIVRY